MVISCYDFTYSGFNKTAEMLRYNSDSTVFNSTVCTYMIAHLPKEIYVFMLWVTFMVYHECSRRQFFIQEFLHRSTECRPDAADARTFFVLQIASSKRNRWSLKLNMNISVNCRTAGVWVYFHQSPPLNFHILISSTETSNVCGGKFGSHLLTVIFMPFAIPLIAMNPGFLN